MTADSIVEAVKADLDARSRRGLAKYGTTLDRTDLDLEQWLGHAYEELLDGACYLKRAMRELGRANDIRIPVPSRPGLCWEAPAP